MLLNLRARVLFNAYGEQRRGHEKTGALTRSLVASETEYLNKERYTKNGRAERVENEGSPLRRGGVNMLISLSYQQKHASAMAVI